jgi:hypothetical protein
MAGAVSSGKKMESRAVLASEIQEVVGDVGIHIVASHAQSLQLPQDFPFVKSVQKNFGQHLVGMLVVRPIPSSSFNFSFFCTVKVPYCPCGDKWRGAARCCIRNAGP